MHIFSFSFSLASPECVLLDNVILILQTLLLSFINVTPHCLCLNSALTAAQLRRRKNKGSGLTWGSFAGISQLCPPKIAHGGLLWSLAVQTGILATGALPWLRSWHACLCLQKPPVGTMPASDLFLWASPQETSFGRCRLQCAQKGSLQSNQKESRRQQSSLPVTWGPGLISSPQAQPRSSPKALTQKFSLS